MTSPAAGSAHQPRVALKVSPARTATASRAVDGGDSSFGR